MATCFIIAGGLRNGTAARSRPRCSWSSATQLEFYVGGDAAAYVARLALEAGHPSADARCAALQAWDRETGDGERGFTPLRGIVVDALHRGKQVGWRALVAHPLYAWRAAFELTLPARA